MPLNQGSNFLDSNIRFSPTWLEDTPVNGQKMRYHIQQVKLEIKKESVSKVTGVYLERFLLYQDRNKLFVPFHDRPKLIVKIPKLYFESHYKNIRNFVTYSKVSNQNFYYVIVRLVYASTSSVERLVGECWDSIIQPFSAHISSKHSRVNGPKYDGQPIGYSV